MNITLLYINKGLFYINIGLFYTNIGLFYMRIRLFPTMLTWASRATGTNYICVRVCVVWFTVWMCSVTYIHTDLFYTWIGLFYICVCLLYIYIHFSWLSIWPGQTGREKQRACVCVWRCAEHTQWTCIRTHVHFFFICVVFCTYTCKSLFHDDVILFGGRNNLHVCLSLFYICVGLFTCE